MEIFVTHKGLLSVYVAGEEKNTAKPPASFSTLGCVQKQFKEY